MTRRDVLAALAVTAAVYLLWLIVSFHPGGRG